MNIQAFDILDKYGFQKPRLFTIDDVMDRLPDKRYYLRYHPCSSNRNAVVTGRIIQNNYKQFKRDKEKGVILHIESTYNMILGGASLIKKGFIYSEVVNGHPISLLRRGCCSTRILQTKSTCVITNVYQGWEAVQGVGEYKWHPSFGISEKTILKITKLLQNEIPIKSHSGLLLEWFATNTKKGIIFCDAREKGFENFGNKLNLFGEKQNISIFKGKNCKGLKNRCNITDGFDVDFRSIPKNCTIFNAVNSAILCHLITRSLDKNIDVNLLSSNLQ